MEKQPVVKQIECVYIPATNPILSAEWYGDYLGLSLTRPASEDQAQLKVGANQHFFLIRTGQPTTLNFNSAGDPEMSALTLEVNDVEALYANMKKDGVKVDPIEDNGGCGISFHAYDPDGNKLHLWGGWPQKKR